jgi:hypothetical protein
MTTRCSSSRAFHKRAGEHFEHLSNGEGSRARKSASRGFNMCLAPSRDRHPLAKSLYRRALAAGPLSSLPSRRSPNHPSSER